ncbi:MAG TPA: glycerophosphodiester phosphodiesterase family protein [Flavobacteriales bacterium]|nr:glycerophosphodiester phosphodiesterase family protein [Flavobacteriales bacterium]
MPRPEPAALLLTLLLSACMPQKNLHPDIHGHRGCRGLLPENSIPAFLKATELGCDFLEMDVVMSKDGELIVSHEPWMRHDLCLTPEGSGIPAGGERGFNLYEMTAAEIRRFDCGSLEDPDHPERDTRSTYKPTLKQVVSVVDDHALLSGVAPPSFNIEVKSDPALYGTFQPAPRAFALSVIAELDDLGITDRCLIQSFDPAILEVFHAERDDIPLAYLVEDKAGLNEQLARLTFVPAVYSPHFSVADEALLQAVREREMELVVWTVNEPADIRRMLDLGVDGIITDYPERAITIVERRD